MKNSWLWLVAAGLAIYLFTRKKSATPNASNPNKTGTAGTTTGTQTTQDPYWAGWETTADTVLQNQTKTVASVTASTKSLYNGIFGLFGGASTSTGRASNPTTNGSGAGVPVDNSRNPVTEGTTSSETDDGTYNESMTDTESQTSDTEDPMSGAWSYN